ncbi:hypothetical protein I553_7553 [Mycobacterium xenopi 4042]|uniref:Uncharacterized protein n=1 Tax=Mycobacterium xenopi 4042 TaxID=1299334 RepID=X8AQR1_MYCXE|nr:hypothetical protein I553_7553 [Mycobacterium xenopi 4042]
MRVDPPATSLRGDVDWTKFTRDEDIPDWIKKAYADSYRGRTATNPPRPTTSRRPRWVRLSSLRRRSQLAC